MDTPQFCNVGRHLNFRRQPGRAGRRNV